MGLKQRTAGRRVYGPVPSRRYGLSLGIDLLPAKVCSYDCLYCQVGRTRRRTLKRQPFFPPGDILAEVERALETGPRPEVITLAGSGDPTLYSPLGELIDGLHELAGLPVVLLTNGGLLWREDVLADALRADVLAPSLDAGDPELFARINRPHPELDFDRMLAGLGEAIGRHPGQVRLEVMLVGGLNDDPAAVERIAERIRGWELTSIDVNTPVRPAPGRRVRACPAERLAEACRRLGPRARIVAPYRGPSAPPEVAADAEERVLALLARRPATVEDLQAALGLDRPLLDALLARLTRQDRVQTSAGAGGTYFFTRGEADGQ